MHKYLKTRKCLSSFISFAIIILTAVVSYPISASAAETKLDTFIAYPPIHLNGTSSSTIRGLTPRDIHSAYNIPDGLGTGTIAIIAAYDNTEIEKDLQTFNTTFGLQECSSKNNCFEKHRMDSRLLSKNDWSLEQSLDVEWAHAIAPHAKILLVEAKTASGKDLLKAIDYARNRPDVVSVSMSWGGKEFRGEGELENHFSSGTKRKIAFFASSGDSGAGVNWPAVSQKVIGVGGTSLRLSKERNVISETAWAGSGGGVSSFLNAPTYQTDYNIPKAKKMRSVPDVSFNADPQFGYAVYHDNKTKNKWYVLGGTSAGAPQWAAIHAIGLSAYLPNIYKDKLSEKKPLYFRDIVSGSNGECKYYCDARLRYDYITGLGSPITSSF